MFPHRFTGNIQRGCGHKSKQEFNPHEDIKAVVRRYIEPSSFFQHPIDLIQRMLAIKEMLDHLVEDNDIKGVVWKIDHLARNILTQGSNADALKIVDYVLIKIQGKILVLGGFLLQRVDQATWSHSNLQNSQIIQVFSNEVGIREFLPNIENAIVPCRLV
jgi:hypothetical protein